MSRTFVLGDIHGAHRALQQVLERANFNYSSDHLIALGDVADGWPETKQCIDEFLRIKNLTFILGNHDYWTLQWMNTQAIDDIWYRQGGNATIASYDDIVPDSPLDLLRNAKPFFKLGNKVFVHAGIDPTIPLEENSLQTLLWDRSLARVALTNAQLDNHKKLTPYDAVYMGHTPIGGKKPLKCGDIWLMDTAAGWTGVLTIMDIDSEEFFSSDPVPTLYPGIEGRKKFS